MHCFFTTCSHLGIPGNRSDQLEPPLLEHWLAHWLHKISATNCQAVRMNRCRDALEVADPPTTAVTVYFELAIKLRVDFDASYFYFQHLCLDRIDTYGLFIVTRGSTRFWLQVVARGTLIGLALSPSQPTNGSNRVLNQSPGVHGSFLSSVCLHNEQHTTDIVHVHRPVYILFINESKDCNWKYYNFFQYSSVHNIPPIALYGHKQIPPGSSSMVDQLMDMPLSGSLYLDFHWFSSYGWQAFGLCTLVCP